MFRFLGLNKSYQIPINDKKDIEFLLEKAPITKKRTESIKVGLHFFTEKTKVTFRDDYVLIVTKLRLRIALLIPFASLIISIILFFEIWNCAWFKDNHLFMIAISLFTNYLILLHLINSAHIKIENYIYSNMYHHKFNKSLKNNI